MAAKSTYLDNAFLAAALTNVAYTPPTTVYAALNTSASTPGTPGSEVGDGNYARQPVTFSVPSGGSTANSGTLAFFGAGAASGPYTIVEVAVYDALVTASGSSATITVTGGPTVTVTGLTGMVAGVVGSPLTISGSSQSTNNGSWVIASYISATSVTITNAAAVTDSGSDTWSVGHELYYGALGTSKTINTSDTVSFAISALAIAEQ